MRHLTVMGLQVCALRIGSLFRRTAEDEPQTDGRVLGPGGRDRICDGGIRSAFERAPVDRLVVRIVICSRSGGPHGAKDRKSVVEGKSVDLGGRRIIKKKK